MTGSGDVWSSFTRDPRISAHAALRASDADREVINQVLAEAYADGRLDRDEFDDRATDVASARTLGELPPIIEGLVPLNDLSPTVLGVAQMTDAELHERAVAEWRSDRRQALWGFLSASLICWTIWLVGSWGPDGFDPYFPWPLFVMLGTGLNAGRTQFQREEMIASERRRLEKKQRKQLEQRRKEDDA